MLLSKPCLSPCQSFCSCVLITQENIYLGQGFSKLWVSGIIPPPLLSPGLSTRQHWTVPKPGVQGTIQTSQSQACRHLTCPLRLSLASSAPSAEARCTVGPRLSPCYLCFHSSFLTWPLEAACACFPGPVHIKLITAISVSTSPIRTNLRCVSTPVETRGLWTHQHQGRRERRSCPVLKASTAAL